jgi:hypothetical protein
MRNCVGVFEPILLNSKVKVIVFAAVPPCVLCFPFFTNKTNNRSCSCRADGLRLLARLVSLITVVASLAPATTCLPRCNSRVLCCCVVSSPHSVDCNRCCHCGWSVRTKAPFARASHRRVVTTAGRVRLFAFVFVFVFVFCVCVASFSHTTTTDIFTSSSRDSRTGRDQRRELNCSIASA